jgi:hypothetical protein
MDVMSVEMKLMYLNTRRTLLLLHETKGISFFDLQHETKLASKE